MSGLTHSEKREIVRKIPPVNMYDIPAVEGWLSEMAAQGLHLYKFGTTFVQLLKSEPRRSRYRMEPVEKINDHFDPQPQDPGLEESEYYGAEGWDYIASYAKIFYVYRDASPQAIEMHTDPIAQSFALRRFYNKQRFNFWLLLAVLATAAIYIGYRVVKMGRVFSFLIAITEPHFIATILFLLLPTMQTRQSLSVLRRVLVRLESGLPVSHEPPKKSRGVWGRIGNLCPVLISAVVLITGILRIIPDPQHSIKDVAGPLPFVPLERIQGEGFYIETSAMSSGGFDYYNHVTLKRTVLAPAQYRFVQFGGTRQTADGGDYYLLFAETNYWLIRFRALTAPLLEEVIEQALTDVEAESEELSHPDFDRAVYAQAGLRQWLFALRGREVVQMEYIGERDLRQVLPDLLDALKGTDLRSLANRRAEDE